MSDAEQVKAVGLRRGLFFVHYHSAEDAASPPQVAAFPAAGHENRMEIILHPDTSEPVLRGPNSRLLVKVNTPGLLHVQVQQMKPGGSRAAVLRIEPIWSREASTDLHTTVATERLKVLGHVASRGDIVVGPNTWIAGPTAPSRVEGLALEWPEKPIGVDIRYAVRFADGQTGSGGMVPLGAYAGTRGQALPLTGLALEVNGTAELEFVAEAAFLNSPIMRAVGKRVVLTRPTDRQPLVGIRIGIERVAAAEQIAASATRRRPAGYRRFRVFRGRLRQESSTS
ncbi:hypothetical protein [Bradyrhizobium sp. USDA 3315]